MKIALIKPHLGKMVKGFNLESGRMEPLQLGVLAALIPPDIEVVLYDDRFEKIPFDDPVDLAAITVETFTAFRSYEIAGEFKKRDVPVVLGGIHPTLIPVEAENYADSIVVGDAESVWETLIKDVINKNLKKRYYGKQSEPQKGLIPRRELFKNKGYLPVSLIQYSRGCKYQCSYCAPSIYFDRKLYFRKIEDVVREIESCGLKHVLFVDDNITADKNKAKELFKELKNLKIKWAGQASLDMTEDNELMDLMLKSGCIGLEIGFESIDINNLKNINKTPNIKNFDNYQSQIRILKDNGLLIWASFTFGYDNDNAETIKKTVEFAIKNKFTLVSFQILMPYPGTAFYKKLADENRLLYNGKWWLDAEYGYNLATFNPKLMSHEELTSETKIANKKFYSIHSIINRALDKKTNMKSFFNLALYCGYNFLYRNTSF